MKLKLFRYRKRVQLLELSTIEKAKLPKALSFLIEKELTLALFKRLE